MTRDASKIVQATVVGKLPGLGAYMESDDDDETSDSKSEDSDIDTDMFKSVIRVHCSGTL